IKPCSKRTSTSDALAKFRRKRLIPRSYKVMITFQKLPDSNMSYRFLQINRGGNG
ncbi:10878_t:CDS:1, partial [Funneliformis mosseae]